MGMLIRCPGYLFECFCFHEGFKSCSYPIFFLENLYILYTMYIHGNQHKRIYISADSLPDYGG